MIAKNINRVKANKTLNNKSVNGSVLSLLPEYAIFYKLLSRLTSDT